MIIGNNKSHMLYGNSVEETIYFTFFLFLVNKKKGESEMTFEKAQKK